MALSSEDFIKGQVALLAWREGKMYGGFHAMECIAHVISNRKRAGWGDWLTVIARNPVFNAREAADLIEEYPDIQDPEFTQLRSVIDGIYDGSANDPTMNVVTRAKALYWGDTQKITRQWFKDEICTQPESHQIVGSFQTLKFWT